MKTLATKTADRPAVLALLRNSGLSVDDIREPVFENFRKTMDESGLTGVAGLELLGGGEALLRSLAVRDDCRGRGIGRKLTRDLERWAQAAGILRLFLLTDTAEQFFAGLGYRSIAREAVPKSVAGTAQFTSLCPASAICMCKVLKP